jgi:hypothetical protein
VLYFNVIFLLIFFFSLIFLLRFWIYIADPVVTGSKAGDYTATPYPPGWIWMSRRLNAGLFAEISTTSLHRSIHPYVYNSWGIV